MKIDELMTDDAVLLEMGKRLAHIRLGRQLTQAYVAEQAGVSKRTVERVEAGASVQMSNMIRVLRCLGLLPGLEKLVPEPVPSPMDLLKLKGKVRKRASSKKRKEKLEQKWSWDDSA